MTAPVPVPDVAALCDADRAKAFELLTMLPPHTDINPYWRVDAIADALAAERAAAARERDRLRDAVAGLAEEHRRWAVINRDLADRMEAPGSDFHIGMAQAQESTTRHVRAVLSEALPGGEK